MALLWFAVGVVAGLLLMHLNSRRPRVAPPTAPETPAIEAPEPAASPVGESAQERLQRLKSELDAQDDRIQRPSDLAALPAFQEGVALLASLEFQRDDVLRLLGENSYVLASMAAAALPRRIAADVQPEAALAAASSVGAYALSFLFDYLQAQPDARFLPHLLRHAREWWWDFQPTRQRLREFLQWAHAHGAADAAPVPLDEYDEAELEQMRAVLGRFQEPALEPFLASLDAALALRRERRVLSGFGRVMRRSGERPRVVYGELEAHLQRLHEHLTGPTPTSVLVSGEPGVGKSALIDLLTDRLHDEGWLVFEATAAEILAGQKFIGELEQRVREMLGVLHRKRALWRVPDFFDLLSKGSHSQDPRGILDLLLPALERRELLLVGEITPRQLSQLLLARPSAKHHFDALTLQPASPSALVEVAKQWARTQHERLGRDVADEATLAEATRMAAHYFPEQHEPGRSLRVLVDALANATSVEPPALPLDAEGLLVAIASRSGLPLDVLDDRRSLDLDTLRRFFRKRVLGQDEAVETLIDRIAMLKAGLVDAGRPIGVFLFAGPTGTGKTELAKALGELLFGSAERLLRLDMSEFQSGDAAWRLTADDARSGTRSLTSRIREQPFSVVLLDEFEKAHPSVWDLFLQVFDDARLTDQNGHTADFRHSIIILTSNVGSTIQRSAGPGFTSAASGYSRSHVEKSLFETFRREFLNRLDRIVLFNPLDRGLMREILHKELDLVLTRRGLRTRDWAVEWEPSAVDFLLDRGFTPDLGARPLRRAIEHHLLAPLARSIVEHRAPEGGQFLFVRSAGDRLEVQFVDPDAGPTPPPALPAASDDGAERDLRDLVYAPDASSPTHARLAARLAHLAAGLASDEWSRARESDFARMAETDFWSDAARFEVLDRIERRDRIESALDTARRLLDRVGRDGGDAEFVARVAQLLFLLDLAVGAVSDGRPQDALIEIAANDADLKRETAETRRWWQELLGMYLAWARRRNMRVDVLRQDPERCSAWLAVSGFGAFDLLECEDGLHVLEQEVDGQATRRLALQVRVAPDLPGRDRRPPARDTEDRRVSRRYRASPSPLVRDTARGWRSGRLDRVLSGEFDVVTDTSA
ncbi:MAG TPA: AAA family ATPase [Lysobacter sp.]